MEIDHRRTGLLNNYETKICKFMHIDKKGENATKDIYFQNHLSVLIQLLPDDYLMG